MLDFTITSIKKLDSQEVFRLCFDHKKPEIDDVVQDNQVHRLRKNVAYAHDGKFQVHSMAEQNVWSDCSRLIVNAIIYYNTFLLSQLLKHHSKADNKKEVEIIQNVSPIAWQHINLAQ